MRSEPAREPRNRPAADAAGTSRLYEEYARPELARMLRVLRLDVAFSRGQGDRLYHVAGGREQQVLDLLGGYGACLFGHNHPELVEVARSSLDTGVPVQAQGSLREGAAHLARRLSDLVGRWTGEPCVTTLANSGAEAVEAAIKLFQLGRARRFETILERCRHRSAQLRRLARGGGCRASPAFLARLASICHVPVIHDLEEALAAWHRSLVETFDRRPVFLALEGAYHGNTVGAVQLTYNREYREPFLGLGFPVVFLPPGDVEALDRACSAQEIEYVEISSTGGALEASTATVSNIAALFVEPVQGEGGIHVLDRAFAGRIRETADRAGFPVVADEIQTGMGRTGTFLAAERIGLKADAYTFSKSLGGGLAKISALTATRGHDHPEFSLLHASTFAEDEPSCRVALKALDLVTRDDGALMRSCGDKGEFLLERLRCLKSIHPEVLADVRGLGLMVGIEFSSQAGTSSRLLYMLSDQELLGYTIVGWFLHEERIRVGRMLSEPLTIRIEPSAFVSTADLERFVEALDRLCQILEKANTYELVKYMVGLETPGARTPIQDFAAPRPELEGPLPARRVAFLGHYIAAEHVPLWEPSLRLMPPDKIERFIVSTARVLGPVLRDRFVVKSPTGDDVLLTFIGLSATSTCITEGMKKRDTRWFQEKIEAGVRLAREAECTVVGFGGYTSIVTNNCQSVAEDGIALTTGNSLTAAMGIEAMTGECRTLGMDMASARLAVVGATGNICSIYVRILAQTVPEIVLIGRPGSTRRLRQLAAEIYEDAIGSIRASPDGPWQGVAAAIRRTRAVEQALGSPDAGASDGKKIQESLVEEFGEDPFVRVSTDMEAIGRCSLVVAASNTAEPIIFPEHLGAGPIVICDIGLPPNVSSRVSRERPDVHVIQGGIVRLPLSQDLVIPGIPLEGGHVFACMAETILLGLAGISRDYSYGAISKAQVSEILALARQHGFGFARVKVERAL